MKKILIILMVLLFCSKAFAAWTFTASRVAGQGNYIYWKVVCLSDGTDPAAANIFASLDSTYAGRVLRDAIKGATTQVLWAVPGTGDAAPTTTIDISMTNEAGVTLFSTTGLSNSAETKQQLNKDTGWAWGITDQLNINLNDIGDSGDSVTLVFQCWK